MSNSILNATYAELNSVYGTSLGSTKYDSHKKDELKSTVKTILNVNKNSPLYRVNNSARIRDFALDIKKRAHIIQNVVASISESEDGIKGVSRLKIAFSSNPEIAEVDYTGTKEDDSLSSTSFKLEVRSLATPQVNEGNYLRSFGHDFKPGSYYFNIDTASASYEFQVDVSETDNNSAVLKKILNLINNSRIGVHAEVVDSNRRSSALRLESEQTGLPDSASRQFMVSPQSNSDSLNLVELLGVDRITSPAENAYFLLNGVMHQSFSNNFTVNNAFSVKLNGVSPEGEPLTIGFKPAYETVAESVNTLASSYNNMIEAANRYPNESASKLLKSNISSVANAFREDLKIAGLSISDNKTLLFDKSVLIESLENDMSDDVYNSLNRFKDSLGKKAFDASLNPMAYVDKTVVSYKDPSKTFVTPYITSIYSGMMFDKFL